MLTVMHVTLPALSYWLQPKKLLKQNYRAYGNLDDFLYAGDGIFLLRLIVSGKYSYPMHCTIDATATERSAAVAKS